MMIKEARINNFYTKANLHCYQANMVDYFTKYHIVTGKPKSEYEEKHRGQPVDALLKRFDADEDLVDRRMLT